MRPESLAVPAVALQRSQKGHAYAFALRERAGRGDSSGFSWSSTQRFDVHCKPNGFRKILEHAEIRVSDTIQDPEGPPGVLNGDTIWPLFKAILIDPPKKGGVLSPG